MVFSSLEFLIIFLPFFLAVYYIVPERFRNICILFFSLYFYAYGCKDTPVYFALIIGSVIFNYITGLLICRFRSRKFFLALGIVVDTGALFVFKYLDFVLGSVNRLSGTELPLTELALPIGISFYTFQIMSYLVDVYRGTVAAEKNIINLGTYITAFPQLIAGPIVKFSDVSAQLHSRKINKDYIVEGAEKLIIGLGFKVILANHISGVWSEVMRYGYADLSTRMAWLGIIGYSMQLYFDFFGYSLMAIGLGKLMGFDFPENFNEPYSAVSMTDFWRRWHITLGGWFRDYVYIPLGGNRKGEIRTCVNLFIVWFLTGIWHGAGVNFILWGLVLATIIVLEKLLYGRFLEKHRWVGHIYMLVLIPLSWLIFVLDSPSDLLSYLNCLVGRGGRFVFAGDWLKSLSDHAVFLAAGVFFCTPIPRKIYGKLKGKIVLIPFLAAILIYSVYCIRAGLNDPFMYFRF